MEDVARVYLHDGSLRRIGELITAADLDRSYLLRGVGQAAFAVSEDEPLLAALDPRLGHVVVIESDPYPVPWVGKVTRLRARRGSGTVEVQAKDLAAVLGERLLGSPAHFEGTAGRVFQDIVATANAVNPTGIGAGDVEQGPRMVGGVDYDDQDALSALDDLAEKAGMEWWLDYTVEPDRIDIVARLATARGEDRTEDVALVDGGNGGWTGWSIDGEAAAFALTVVGGQASVVGTYLERPRERAVRAGGEGFTSGGPAVAPVAPAPHGYVADVGPVPQAPASRRERVVLAEALKSRELVQDAARVLLIRQPSPERVVEATVWRRAADGSVVDWSGFGVGDIITLALPGALLEGYRGPARIVGAHPDEASGELVLALELVRRVNA